MNSLVIGGAGFIGSNLTHGLLNGNHNVYVIDNFITGKRENLEDLSSDKLFELDVSKQSSIKKIKSIILNNSIDTVFHLAALPNVQYSFEYPSKAHQSTLTTTINLLESIKDTKITQVIFSSTSAVYGNTDNIPINEQTSLNPLSFYALQKLMSEQYLKMFSSLYGTKVICLRYFNVFGKNMTHDGAYKSVISTFLEQKLKNKPLTIYNDGNQSRDFISVDDVIRANILCSTTKLPEQFTIFNVGSGNSTTVNELADCFKISKTYMGNRTEPLHSLCDNTAIKTALGWKPTVQVKDWINKKLQIY